MRDWNVNHPDDPVYFHGFDVQFWWDGADRFLKYVERVDPEYAETIEDDIFCLNERQFIGNSGKNCLDTLLTIMQHYHSMQDDYSQSTSTMDYLLHRQALQTVIDYDALDQAYRDGDEGLASNIRDIAMAGQIIAFAEDIFPDDRIVLWAHNAHVQSADLYIEGEQELFQPMGTHLRDHLEDDYVTMGFAFNTGSFNAIEIFNSGAYGNLRSMSVLPIMPDSHEHILTSFDEPRYFLDTRVDTSSPAYEWLNRDLFLRTIGAVYNVEAQEEQFAFRARLQEAFNVIIYFDDTSPTVLLR